MKSPDSQQRFLQLRLESKESASAEELFAPKPSKTTTSKKSEGNDGVAGPRRKQEKESNQVRHQLPLCESADLLRCMVGGWDDH